VTMMVGLLLHQRFRRQRVLFHLCDVRAGGHRQRGADRIDYPDLRGERQSPNIALTGTAVAP
jgi:hypothetical protein